MSISPAADGFYHPSSTAEVAALIKQAFTDGTHVRVSGAQLSVAESIHNDGFDGNGTPPPGPIEIKLDELCQVEWVEKTDDHATLWVQCGCLLGRAYDDPTGQSWKTSLTYLLEQEQYALDQLAGVSHQTLGGFLMTGSAGGSVRHAIHDDIEALELVDGTGEVHLVARDSSEAKDQDLFFAAGVSVGLLGVLTRVKLRARKRFNIEGAEDTTRFTEAAADLEGDGALGKPSFADYLTQTDYARMLWWPQNDFDRVQIWHASRREPTGDFERLPFEVLSPRDALLGSLVYVIIGNLDDMSVVHDKLKEWKEALTRYVDGQAQPTVCPEPVRQAVSRQDVLDSLRQGLHRVVTRHPDMNEGMEHTDADVRELVDTHGARDPDDQDWHDWMARLLVHAVDSLLDGGSGVLLAKLLKRILPGLIDELLGLFLHLGSRPFRDSWMCGLPMDNGMSAALWHTYFTELWVPLDKTKQVVATLHDYFNENDKHEAYRRTGPYAIELYSGPKSEFWMSPGYGTPCVRVNVFWFAKWAGSPRDSMYPPLWQRLKPLGFRPHWGKFLPSASTGWVEHYRSVLAHFDDFMLLRAELDPKKIFVSSYWRQHLGI